MLAKYSLNCVTCALASSGVWVKWTQPHLWHFTKVGRTCVVIQTIVHDVHWIPSSLDLIVTVEFDPDELEGDVMDTF